jgi:hypothetical protein
MSDFTEQSELSNQNRSNIVSFSDVTSRSAFFAAQRSKIADIIAIAVKIIQMQQLTSSFTNATLSSDYNQTIDFIKK